MDNKQTSNRIVTIGHSTDQGAREYQDDNCGYRFELDGSLLAVLADGMGGYYGGDVASELAVTHFGKYYSTLKGRIPDRLKKALYFANNKISEKASLDEELREMGTTLIAVSVSPGVLHWISVGDSLLYLIREGKLTQLNTEHSLKNKMENLFAKGKISEEELTSLKNPSALTSTLGRDLINEIDNPNVPMPLLNGDRLVIASDGILTLTESKIISMVTSLPTPQKAADSLINLVKQEGKKNQDNVTVMVIYHEKESSKKIPAKKVSNKNKLSLFLIAGFVLSSFLLTLFFVRSNTSVSNPVAKEKALPVAKEKALPVAKEKAPSVAKEKAPLITKEKAPSVAEEKTPPITKEKAPPVTKEKAPPVTKEKAPPVTKEKAPPVTKEKAPPVAKEKAPLVKEVGLEGNESTSNKAQSSTKNLCDFTIIKYFCFWRTKE